MLFLGKEVRFVVAGVTVGENALVGAGSVVSRDVSEGMVIYGEKANARRQIGGPVFERNSLRKRCQRELARTFTAKSNRIYQCT